MKVILKSIVASVAVLSLAACSKGDLYDANQVAANKMAEQKQKFENNFEVKYGKVDPNQSWDFSTNQQRLGTRGNSEVKTQIVNGLEFNPTYDVVEKNSKLYLDNRKFGKNQAIYDNVIKQLPDKKEHKGNQATLVAPSNSFTIYPISAQGAWTHDLYVKVGDADPVKVYSKTWTDYSRPYVNGDVISATANPVYKTETYEDKVWVGGFFGHYETVEKTREVFDHYEYEATSSTVMPGLYIEAPVGTPIEIYLDNVKNGDTKKPSVGTSTGNVIYVDGKGAVPEGVEIREDAIIKYVGIEDQANLGDKDYNDIVLAIVGNPDVPEEIIIENNEYKVPLSVTKRYMMEDLGSTDDFDFNDVVVDVTETTVYTHTVTVVNGVKTSDEITKTEKLPTAKAVVRHLGGIYPFVLKVGNTTFDKMGGEDTFDKDVNIEKDVTGWDPTLNNVSVTVEVPDKTQGSKMYDAVNEFPKVGEFPMMFTCDPEVKWAAEKQEFDFGQFPGYKGTK